MKVIKKAVGLVRAVNSTGVEGQEGQEGPKQKKPEPVSGDLIREHGKRLRQLEQWREDVPALRAILKDLNEKYDLHRGNFPIKRYRELKRMTKTAVTQFHAFLKTISDRRYDSDLRDEKQKEEEKKKKGAIVRLREDAEQYAELQKALTDKEERYAGMTNDDVTKELQDMKEEIRKLEEENKILEASVEKLRDDYAATRSIVPGRRYEAMKSMIKSAFQPSASLPSL